jgi:predicted anti-sigma-YlaC factor YlaD
MRCDDCRSALSARLDGEDPACPEAAVAAHLDACGACRAWSAAAAALQRATRLAPAAVVPDLTPAILHAIGRESVPRERAPGLRVCLALVGLVQIATAIPALVLGDDANLPVHTARHLGSFAVALAIGFLFAAWKPERAGGLLPVAAALVACIVGTSALDVIAGRTAAVGETGHLTEIVGLAITWLLARPSPLSSRPRPVRA